MAHKVIIKLDTSEGQLRDWLKQLPSKDNIKHEKLPVGDILFLVDDKPTLLIERKEVNDFRGSVATNRFREQRSRMLDLRKEYPQLVLVFLIEGQLDKLYYNPKSLIQLPYLENLVNDLGPKYGICRLSSRDTLDTLRLIGRYENIYKKGGSAASIVDADSITGSLSIGKKRGMDRTQFGACTLSLIPGMTREAAMAVSVIYPTLFSLISFYDGIDSHRECEELLIGVRYGNGLTVGKTVSKRVYQYLMDIFDEPEKKKPKSKSPPRDRSRSPKRPTKSNNIKQSRKTRKGRSSSPKRSGKKSRTH